MDKVQQMLDNNIALRTGDWNLEEVAKINELIPECITLKPIVYLPNVDAKSFRRKGETSIHYFFHAIIFMYICTNVNVI